LAKSVCEAPEQLAKFEQALAAVTGQHVRIEFREREASPDGAEAAPANNALSEYQRRMQLARHPMVRLASELFGAHPVRVEEPPPPQAGDRFGSSAQTEFGSADG